MISKIMGIILVTLFVLLNPSPILTHSNNETSKHEDSLINDCMKSRVNYVRENGGGMSKARRYARILEKRIFVDKSMLIKHILDSEFSVNSITTPRWWGKTINLSMLQMFFQPPGDVVNGKFPPLKIGKNFHLFRHGKIIEDGLFRDSKMIENEGVRHLEKPLLISKYNEIIDRHLGQHSVIYLDLLCFFPKNYEEAMEHVVSRIADAFKEHIYLWDIMRQKLTNSSSEEKIIIEDDIRRLENYTFYKDTKTFQTAELVNSISFLSRMLIKYLNFKKPIILIDEFDAHLNHAFIFAKWSNDDKDKLFNFFKDFFQATFASNETFYIAVLTGSLCISEQELFKGVNGFKHTNFLNDDPVFTFYGFSENEVKDIFNISGLPRQNYEKVCKFYGSYRAGENFFLKLYNPSSISNYLAVPSIQIHGIGSGRLENLLRTYIPSKDFHKHIVKLIDGGVIEVNQLLNITKEELNDLLHHCHTHTIRSNTKLPENLINTLLKLLATAGYLTPAISEQHTGKTYVGENNTFSLRIPNIELRNKLLGKLPFRHNATSSYRT